jgi:hypothetical protein
MGARVVLNELQTHEDLVSLSLGDDTDVALDALRCRTLALMLLHEAARLDARKSKNPKARGCSRNCPCREYRGKSAKD